MKFRLFNQRRQILTVADRWAAQYPQGRSGINEKLDALDKTTCSAEEVNKIIGNDSWTRMFCSGCDEYADRGVVFDNGDGDTNVCETCLRSALAVLTSQC